MPQHIGAFRDRMSIADLPSPPIGLVGGVLDRHGDALILRDHSGGITLDPTRLTPACCKTPAWVALRFTADGAVEVVYHQPIQATTAFRDLQVRRGVLEQRLAIHQAVRRWFLDHGFHETDTPIRVHNPGMEPFLDGVSADGLWLRTSPELHMKRLLAAGFDQIFQMGPCFRGGDHGSLHREEFHMLEWYRAFADLNHLIQDIQSLFQHLAPLTSDPAWFRAGLEVISCEQLFKRHLDHQLTTDLDPLRDLCRAKGLSVDADDDWDTLYFLLFLNFIEPHLGHDRPTIVTGYPATQAALAKLAPPAEGVFPTCYRFELYVRGMELANAFYELTDEPEQRRRFQEDNRTRAALEKPTYPLDENFLAALASGIPPSAGIALGVDRLVLACLNRRNMEEILPFPSSS